MVDGGSGRWCIRLMRREGNGEEEGKGNSVVIVIFRINQWEEKMGRRWFGYNGVKSVSISECKRERTPPSRRHHAPM